MSWTQSELDALAKADAEIDATFCMTREEMATSRKLDEAVIESRMSERNAKRKQYNRAYNRRYYQRHKTELLTRHAEYRAANRERFNETCAAWHKRNAEYDKIWQKAYYDENREFILAKNKSRYEVEKAYRKIIAEMGENA